MGVRRFQTLPEGEALLREKMPAWPAAQGDLATRIWTPRGPHGVTVEDTMIKTGWSRSACAGSLVIGLLSLLPGPLARANPVPPLR